MNFKIVYLLFFLTLSRFSWSQYSTDSAKWLKNDIQFRLGLTHSRLIDQGLTSNKLLFRGTNTNLSLAYGREAKSYSFQFLFKATFGKLKSNSGNLPVDFFMVNPEITYLRRLRDINPHKVEFMAGLDLSSINFILENEPLFDNISIRSFHGAYFTFRNIIRLSDKQSIQFTYRLPAIIYANSILWNGGASDLTYKDREQLLQTLFNRGEFYYFNVFRNIQFNVEHDINLTTHLKFTTAYHFYYLSTPRSKPFDGYANGLQCGLKWGF